MVGGHVWTGDHLNVMSIQLGTQLWPILQIARKSCFFYDPESHEMIRNSLIIHPIGSMYAIYGNIYHHYTPNVSIYIYISYMDPMGITRAVMFGDTLRHELCDIFKSNHFHQPEEHQEPLGPLAQRLEPKPSKRVGQPWMIFFFDPGFSRKSIVGELYVLYIPSKPPFMSFIFI